MTPELIYDNKEDVTGQNVMTSDLLISVMVTCGLSQHVGTDDRPLAQVYRPPAVGRQRNPILHVGLRSGRLQRKE